MLSNCATIFKGEYRDVRINSEPDDTQVYALTGAWYEFDQRYVNAILERQQPRLN
jgi:hypothetical protein